MAWTDRNKWYRCFNLMLLQNLPEELARVLACEYDKVKTIYILDGIKRGARQRRAANLDLYLKRSSH